MLRTAKGDGAPPRGAPIGRALGWYAAHVSSLTAPAATLLAVCLALPAPAGAWGEAGHRVVAAVAEARLGPAARDLVREIAGYDRLSSAEIAAWADAQRDPARRAWHYVNIPFSSGRFLAARDCPGGACAVAAIAWAEEVLRHPATRGDEQAQAEALRWLVHLVADLHQPLHAGDGRDRGGNELRVRVRRRREPTNLHRVWDHEVLASVVGPRGAEVAAAGILARVRDADAAGWAAEAEPAAWAEESSREARAIYAGLGRSPGDGALEPLSPWDYERVQRPRAEVMLARAGVRLAAVLDRIAAARFPDRPPGGQGSSPRYPAQPARGGERP